MTKIKKLRQSLSKAYFEYKNGEECGEKIKRVYIDGEFSEPTGAQRLGLYFEWAATGGGRETDALFTKGGKTMLADYKRATIQAQNFKNDIINDGIEILETSLKLDNEFLTGEFDLLCMWEGRKCIIDLKYSGMYNDKYSPFGWNVDTLADSHKIIQAKQYKLLAMEKYGEEIDFYYFVFNSKNEERKYIKVECGESSLVQHAKDSLKILNKINEDDLKPLPSLSRCSSCQFTECLFKQVTPDRYVVYVE
jgi:CRISPR/Cas system-associated exonuclease Cas4 (RecB family)